MTNTVSIEIQIADTVRDLIGDAVLTGDFEDAIATLTEMILKGTDD